jgi:hypothetical protein
MSCYTMTLPLFSAHRLLGQSKNLTLKKKIEFFWNLKYNLRALLAILEACMENYHQLDCDLDFPPKIIGDKFSN